jgi:hypothetical protein
MSNEPSVVLEGSSDWSQSLFLSRRAHAAAIAIAVGAFVVNRLIVHDPSSAWTVATGCYIVGVLLVHAFVWLHRRVTA